MTQVETELTDDPVLSLASIQTYSGPSYKLQGAEWRIG